MDIIDFAVAKVLKQEEELDPNSREFMLKAFKDAPSIPDLDPWRTGQDVIDDEMMKYTSLYNNILNKLIEEHNARNI